MNFKGSADSNQDKGSNVGFVIPDDSLDKAGIGCSWRKGNELTVFPSISPQNPNTNRTSQDSPKYLHKVRQSVVLFTPTLRKLVNESNGIFLALQKMITNTKGTENSLELLKFSRQYRSILRACLENVQESTETERNEEKNEELMTFVTIFYTMECVWHLCEILFIETVPGDIILPHLLEWVRFHFPVYERLAASIIDAQEIGSENLAEYWDSVVGMVMHGRVDAARALLRLHSNHDNNEFKLVDNALRTMPMFSVYSGVSAGEFNVIWKHWQLDCKSKITSRSLQNEPHLELIMKLLTGEYSALEHVRGKYESWSDVIGGWLLYTEPTARLHGLAAHANACARLRGGKESHLDDVLLSIMEMDLHQVIHEIQNISDNGWLATHLTDLIYHTGKLKILDDQQVNVTYKLRNSLIMEYGCLMMDHKSLWQVGLSYLATCAEGRARAEVILPTLANCSDAKLMKIVSEANKYGLESVASQVCALASARCLSGGSERLGAALAWALRSRVAQLASQAAHRILQHYVKTGKLVAADSLLSTGPLPHATVIFLRKYCEFHQLYESREFSKAGQLLVSLFTSKITPDYFWSTLLLDALPMLESDELIFSADDSVEILHCLEVYGDSIESRVQTELLQLALARNLARTMHDMKEEIDVS